MCIDIRNNDTINGCEFDIFPIQGESGSYNVRLVILEASY